MHVLLVSLLALAIPVASQQPQIGDISPFLGTWTLNAAESKLGTLPHPVRLAVTFEVLGSDGMKVSTDQVLRIRVLRATTRFASTGTITRLGLAASRCQSLPRKRRTSAAALI